MKDSWESGVTYERFMGRWSRIVAREFLNWLSPASGLKWLDIGCGSGALSEALLRWHAPADLNAIDQSQEFVEVLQSRLGNRAACRVGNALALSQDDSSVDIAVSGLVLNFMSDQDRALSEMMRVTAPGGTVAVYVWDYAGRMDLLRYFWDAVVALDPGALSLHEARRFSDSTADAIKARFENAGLEQTETAAIEIDTCFQDFDDYWRPFLGGQGPAPTYVQSLDEHARSRLRDLLDDRLPTLPDGSIPMIARAWAVKAKSRGRESWLS
jgi:ubiquinone/menaquinone biosynthesis C-methylase UbiE